MTSNAETRGGMNANSVADPLTAGRPHKQNTFPRAGGPTA